MASARLLLFRLSERLRSNGHGEDLFSVEEVRRERLIKTLDAHTCDGVCILLKLSHSEAYLKHHLSVSLQV